MVRPPRPLWDLHQQVLSLQEARRRKGLEPLPPAALADRLACDPARLEEALQVRSAGKIRSLDAPFGQGGGDTDAAGCLLDLLASPAGSGEDEELLVASEARSAERQWLRQQLADLDPRDRELLVGRIDVGCTWVELGRQLGMPARQAQRRCDAVLDRLRRAALAWRQQALSPPRAPATAPGPWPAGPPAASAAR
jgi:RNA polymerase sigma-B factor